MEGERVNQTSWARQTGGKKRSPNKQGRRQQQQGRGLRGVVLHAICVHGFAGFVGIYWAARPLQATPAPATLRLGSKHANQPHLPSSCPGSLAVAWWWAPPARPARNFQCLGRCRRRSSPTGRAQRQGQGVRRWPACPHKTSQRVGVRGTATRWRPSHPAGRQLTENAGTRASAKNNQKLQSSWGQQARGQAG